MIANSRSVYRDTVEKKILTTFCLNSSNLSHFNLVMSCRRPSTRDSLFGASQQHIPQGLPLGVSADDMLSRPVSLSTAPAMPSPSSSTLFNDDESLSDMATRLAPLRKHKKPQRLRLRSTTIIHLHVWCTILLYGKHTWKSCAPDGCPDWIWAMRANSFCCSSTTIYQTANENKKHE